MLGSIVSLMTAHPFVWQIWCGRYSLRRLLLPIPGLAEHTFPGQRHLPEVRGGKRNIVAWRLETR